jgi:hypothetical protein
MHAPSWHIPLSAQLVLMYAHSVCTSLQQRRKRDSSLRCQAVLTSVQVLVLVKQHTAA